METKSLTDTLRNVLVGRMKELESRGGGEVLVEPPLCKILVEGISNAAWIMDLTNHTLEPLDGAAREPAVGGTIALSAWVIEQIGMGEIDVRTALEDRAIHVSGHEELFPYLDTLFTENPMI